MTQSIGEVARELGVSIDTLRYYEKAGLADPPGRDPGGRRRYTAEDAGWLQFLVRMRGTGMPIRLLHTYAAARELGPGGVTQRRQILQTHRAEVLAHLAELTESLALIDYKIDNYARLEAGAHHHTEEVSA